MNTSLAKPAAAATEPEEFSVAEFTRWVEKCDLRVVLDPARDQWFSVTNREQIAMFHALPERFISGWCVTPNGRMDTTRPSELLAAIWAVIS